MKTKLFTLAMALASITMAARGQNITFSPATDIPIANNARQIDHKDLNGDGKPDLVVLFANSMQMGIFMNRTAPGAATATYGPIQYYPLLYYPLALLVEDFDADSKPDIIVSYAGGPGAISGFSNNTPMGSSTPSFGSRMEFSSYAGINALATGDFNNDGRLDLAVVTPSTSVVTILYNSPISGTTGWYLNNGGWNIPVAPNPQTIAVADINQDGKQDIITSNNVGTISTLFNYSPQGSYSISFGSCQNSTLGGAAFLNLLTGDMNNDGKSDLVLSNNLGGYITVIINNTTPGSPAVAYSVPQQFICPNPIDILLKDFNKDGKLDILAIPNISPNNTITVLKNSTPIGASIASFEPKQDITTQNYPSAITSGDLNNDGKPDMGIVTNSGYMEIMMNATVTGALTSSFTTHTEMGTTIPPEMGTSGDLNNDGKPDLITVNGTNNSVSVFFNSTSSGSTTPTYGPRQHIPGLNTPVQVVAADFTMDGKKDILTINKYDGYLGILTNTTSPGAPIFSYYFQYVNSMGTPLAVTVGDINADGKLDIVATSSNGGIYIFINATTPGGSPAFSQYAFGVGGLAYSVSLQDMNRDGKPDIIAANYPANSVNIYLNNSPQGGGFSYSGPQILPAIEFPTSITTTDINSDGFPDITVGNEKLVAIYLNTTPFGSSTITVAPKTEYYSGFGIVYNSLVSTDFNGDGLIDLAFTNKNTNIIGVLQNNTNPGSGTAVFQPEQDFATGTTPNGLFFDDMNLDNKPDLFTTSFTGNYISMLVNTAAAALPVTYYSFTGTRNGETILLQWACTAEWNNKGFGIEKSAEGIKWEPIGYVMARESNSLLKKYSFTDDNPLIGKNYYRLRQEDSDGKNTYSKLVVVHYSLETSFKLNACYPNPFQQTTTIKYSIPVNSTISIRVYNAEGKEVAVLQNGQKTKGEYTIQWNAGSLANGVYYIKLIAGEFSVTERVIKSN